MYICIYIYEFIYIYIATESSVATPWKLTRNWRPQLCGGYIYICMYMYIYRFVHIYILSVSSLCLVLSPCIFMVTSNDVFATSLA